MGETVKPGSDVKRMSVKEFREAGYLQELNRRFLHPLGLALEVFVEDDGEMRFGGVWDYRDDPEGMIFGPDILESDEFRTHLENVVDQMIDRRPERMVALGYWIQPPIPKKKPEASDGIAGSG
jgi:hypothetical protein